MADFYNIYVYIDSDIIKSRNSVCSYSICTECYPVMSTDYKIYSKKNKNKENNFRDICNNSHVFCNVRNITS